MNLDDPEFAARRTAARKRLDAIDDKGASDPHRRAWFEKVYELAGDDPANIPWADLCPHPLLTDWLAKVPSPRAGARALDIGCGLGDNAAAIAGKGWRATGFDLTPVATVWASKRFPVLDFVAADIFAPPAEWAGAFDLVHECYTLQALPPDVRESAIAAIAHFVAPGGRLLVIARSREADTPASGPPWPLTAEEIMAFVASGLSAETVDQLPDPTDGKPHWRGVFRRA